MALSTDTNKAQYNCNGSTTEFDLDVRILDEDDVSVFLKNTTTGIQTQLTKTTEYTIAAISGDYDNGARVTTVATYSSAYQITLLREVDYTQDLDLEEGGDLPSDSLEDALDKGVMQAQQLSEIAERTISAPTSDASGLSYDIGTAEERASKVLGYDASGNVTQVALAETGTVGVDTNAGLSISSNIISAKVDASSINFDGTGKMEVPDGGITTAKLFDGDVTTAKIDDEAVTLAKMADLSNMTVIGRKTAGSGVPEEMTVNDDDDLSTASATTLATDESIKAYIDGALSLLGNGYYETSTGLLIKWGKTALIDLNGGSTGSKAATFSQGTAFTTLFCVIPGWEGASVLHYDVTASALDVTTSGFTAWAKNVIGVSFTTGYINWIAIGK